MKVVIQRVKKSEVKVEEETVGKIGRGLLVFLGIGKEDTKEDADWLLNKIVNLRIFADKQDKMNKDLKQVEGELLIVSQFTLLGDCKKGRRPSFDKVASPDKAKSLYNYFIEKAKKTGFEISTGEFGKFMQVELINDGPVTFVLDSELKTL